ncbi:MAG: tRNA (adenosine(37)-N6)-threonylcarbamoyltransferase complex dimerization subunit type 1 TsaB [Lentilitoribacter sp.]
MIILAVDTAGPMCAACLYDGESEKPIAAISKEIGRGHAEHLPSVIQDVLDQAALTFKDITHLAVTIGPGSFAGIRVGISYCRALALALKIPATGISSLNAMAYGVLPTSKKDALAVLDARRGEVYLSALSASGEAIIEPKALTYEDALPVISSGQFILCGNGILPIKEIENDAFSEIEIAHENAFPEIEMVAKLAVNLIKDDIVQAMRPQYLRQADAKPNVNFALDRA